MGAPSSYKSRILANQIRRILDAQVLHSDLGGRIRKWRMDHGHTQRDIAQKLIVTPQYLCDVELGWIRPSPDFLTKLLSLL